MRFINSINREEKRKFEDVKRWISEHQKKSVSEHQKKSVNVECKNCQSIFAAAEILAEKLLPCKGIPNKKTSWF